MTRKNRRFENQVQKRILLTIILLFACLEPVHADIKTYTCTVRQPFSGSQSPDDARAAAVARAKRDVLEKAGIYIERLFIVREYLKDQRQKVDIKDELMAISTAVFKAEIISEKKYLEGDSFGLEIVARVRVDTSVLEERVQSLLQNKDLVEKFRASQKREKELLTKLEALEAENRHLKELSARQEEQLGNRFRQSANQLSAVAWFNKAHALWHNGRYTDPETAIEYYNQAIRLDPAYAAAYYNRGLAYHDLKQFKLSIRDYGKAIELEANFTSAFNNRGNAYSDLKHYRLAIDDYNKALELDPNYSQAYNNRGNAYMELDRYRRAIEDYGQAIRLDPDNAVAYYNRGMAFSDLGDSQSACKDLKTACQKGICSGLDWASNKGLNCR